MPTYEYVCNKCGYRTALIVLEGVSSISCVTCKIEMTRIWDLPGVIFKEEPYAERLKYMEENGI